jgi:predicted nucleotidyltransferase
MKLHDVLGEVLATPVHVRALRVLLRTPGRSWTGRELAGVAGSSAPQTLGCLKRFEHLGLVWRTTVGRSHLWQLEQDHVLVKPLRSLFEFESALPDRFRSELRADLRGLPIRKATLFGSMARGNETNDSDADVCLELEDTTSEEQVQESLTPIVQKLIRRWGTSLSPIIYEAGATDGPRCPPLIIAIRQGGVSLHEGPE